MNHSRVNSLNKSSSSTHRQQRTCSPAGVKSCHQTVAVHRSDHNIGQQNVTYLFINVYRPNY